MSQLKPLVGSIFERNPGSSAASTSRLPQNSKTGFPAVQHRSQSAFARGRDATRSKDASISQNRPVAPPAVKPTPSPRPDDWRAQVGKENARKVTEMTDEEREREKREIMEKFGPDIADVLKRARQKRERERGSAAKSSLGDAALGEHMEPVSVNDDRITSDVNGTTGASHEHPNRDDTDLVKVARRARSLSPTRPIISSPTSRAASPSRLSRKIRFADVTPSDVYVYESQPPSPKRKAALALPPPSADTNDAISLGTFKGSLATVSSLPDAKEAQVPATVPPHPPEPFAVVTKDIPSGASTSRIDLEEGPDEGTAEDIRRRFFPSMPANDPNLEWMSTLPPRGNPSSDLRFDLSGAPIPLDVSETLPTHLGLHHHAEGSRAGYTLDDIFLLSRSTVPAQRTTMLGVLARIVHRLRRRAYGDGLDELSGKEDEIRMRALAAGAEAMGPKGAVVTLAVDVLWECVVGWDEYLEGVDGVELQPEPSEASKDALATVPLDFFLAQVASAFGAAALPPESLTRLLEIVRRLAKHTAAIAEAIVKTSSLLPNMMRLFVLTPIPPPQDGIQPSPQAIRTLTIIAGASRTAAFGLADYADSLLRYVTLLPTSSPFSKSLANALLSETLTFYATLASYGLYAHTATTAQDLFTRLTAYVLSDQCNSRAVRKSYALLFDRWIVCATDPHCTTPEHEILWSQIDAWGWAEDLLKLPRLLKEDVREREVWGAVWGALAAWLEGARVNGVKGGESERVAVVSSEGFRESFANGVQSRVVMNSVDALRALVSEVDDGRRPEDIARLQTIASTSRTLTASIRLWLACCPPGVLSDPPFIFPFDAIRELAFMIANSPILSTKYQREAPSYLHIFCRSLTALLAQYTAMVRKIPDTGEGRWLGLACSVLVNLMPGDEEAAQTILSQILDVINPDFLASKGLPSPAIIWERGGMNVIRPFLTSHLTPMGNPEDYDPFISPLVPTPRSIKIAATQTLPPAWAVRRRSPTAGLPYPRDWPFLPLEHLLKSGISLIWQYLPPNWDANETELVRATMLLAKVVRDALAINGLDRFAVQRAEAIFGCMRVFMLEHGQVQGAPAEDGPNTASSSEVFRDTVVTSLLEDVLAPYTLHKSPDGLYLQSTVEPTAELELAAAPYLGTGTPFFQFYTDFVALYDAVSFGHPTFATLLLPPLSRVYATDYRRLLFADLAHVLGSVQTAVERVPASRVGEFLWPAEDDPQVIGAYVGILVGRRGRGTPGAFIRWLIVHHVAANIWPDLRREDNGDASEDRARKLLQAVFAQGRIDDIREIVGYAQPTTGNAMLPPACFTAVSDEARVRRRHWVQSWADAQVVERLESLLNR